MLERILLEEKEKETLYEKLKEIAPLDELYYIEKKEEGKLFKSPKYQMYVVKKDDIKKFIKNYFNYLGEQMGLELHSEIREEDGIINVRLITDNAPILIGKEGKNLDALQTLLRQSITTQVGFMIKVNLDISDYKLKKQKKLEWEIKNIAREVLASKIDVKLDPMNAFDRRIVHSVISNYHDLATVSEGEAPNRYVIIKYKES